MVTNDIAALMPGQGCHAALLTVKGKLLGDLIVYDCGNFGLLLELYGSAVAKVRGALERHLIMDDATVVDISQDALELGVYGPGAAAALAAVTGIATANELVALPPYHFKERPRGETEPGDTLSLIVAATRELGILGFHLIGSQAELSAIAEKFAAHGGSVLEDAEAEILRVEAGTPIYGVDLDEDRMPAEAGLDDAISYTKGCYLGQEVVVRLRDRGHLNRKLSLLKLIDGGKPPVHGTRLAHPEKPNAGVITSAVFSPRSGLIALGYIHRVAWEPGTRLELVGEDNQPLGRTAEVVPLPHLPQTP